MKIIMILGLLIVVAAGAAVFAGQRHDARLWRDHVRVQAGMSAGEAAAILGEPSWRGRCGARFPYGQAANCASELGYRAAFAPLNPLYWVVQLDASGRVIRSDWIASP
jgi:hypothetical protein